jgi:hypothetical protein
MGDGETRLRAALDALDGGGAREEPVEPTWEVPGRRLGKTTALRAIADARVEELRTADAVVPSEKVRELLAQMEQFRASTAAPPPENRWAGKRTPLPDDLVRCVGLAAVTSARATKP